MQSSFFVGQLASLYFWVEGHGNYLCPSANVLSFVVVNAGGVWTVHLSVFNFCG